MSHSLPLIVVGLLLLSSQVISAPVAQDTETPKASDSKSNEDATVEQLEKLKNDAASTHMEHKTVPEQLAGAHEADSATGAHASGGTAAQPAVGPGVHAIGVHALGAQDITTSPPELTTKVFHGAGRLIQAGLGSSAPVGHTAVRRSFNADITKETHHNMDHYSSYAGVQYSPLDMAEYVFWTGDEQGVTNAVEEFLQEGMMSKEEAIAFLQEIKYNLDYLRAHYATIRAAAEDGAQQDRMRTLLLEQAGAADYQYRNPALQSFPFGNSPDIIRSIANKNWELSNNVSPYVGLPVSSDLKPEPAKRTLDPMLQTNILSTSDYDRDGPAITEEEYEEMMDKLKAADSLYTEYTLEEIIYQLSKMMFSQTLSRDPLSARAATQRFMAFLEAEAERGQLSRSIEKKVLDIMIAALTDTVGDHQELMQPREGSVPAANRLMRQFLDTSSSEPGMSRAILAAYKDELLKGPPMKLPDRLN